jgi:hypothetical protein
MKKIILFIVMALSSCCTIFGADNQYHQTTSTVVFQQFPEGMDQFSSLFKDAKQVRQILNLLHLRKTVIEKIFVESCNKGASREYDNPDNIYTVYNIYTDNKPKFRQETKVAYEQAELAYSQADDIVKKCIDYIETFFGSNPDPVLKKSIMSTFWADTKRSPVIGTAILTYNSIRPLFAINSLPESQGKKFSNLSSTVDLSTQSEFIVPIYMARDEYKIFINTACKLIVERYPNDKTNFPPAAFELESKLVKKQFDQDTSEQIANILRLATLCKIKKELIQHLQAKQKIQGGTQNIVPSTHYGSSTLARLKTRLKQKQLPVLLPQLLSLETITEQDIINQINASPLEPAIKSELSNIVSFDISIAVKIYFFKIEEKITNTTNHRHILDLKLVPEGSIEEEAARCLKDPVYLKELFDPITKKTTTCVDTKQPIQEQPKQNPTKKKKHKKRQPQKQTIQKASTSSSSSSSSSAPSSLVSSSTISAVKEAADTKLETQTQVPLPQETPTTQKANDSKQETQQTKNNTLDVLKSKEIEPVPAVPTPQAPITVTPVTTKPNNILSPQQQFSNLHHEAPTVTNSSSSSSSSSSNSPVSSSTTSTVKETTDTNIEKQLSTPPLQETPTTQKADDSKQEAQQTKNDVKPKEIELVTTKPNDIQAQLQQLSNLQREVPAVTNSSSSSSSSSLPNRHRNPEKTVQLPSYLDGHDTSLNYSKFGYVLDLDRGQQGGYQNQMFIIKKKTLPENYLAEIRYSQEVRGKMMTLNDTNHSFSPLVEKMFGQFASEFKQTPVDPNSADFKKGFKYKYEIKIDGIVASLGCPFEYISSQINQGANMATGQFEFIVLYNPDKEERCCVHRFFRPYR